MRGVRAAGDRFRGRWPRALLDGAAGGRRRSSSPAARRVLAQPRGARARPARTPGRRPAAGGCRRALPRRRGRPLAEEAAARRARRARRAPRAGRSVTCETPRGARPLRVERARPVDAARRRRRLALVTLRGPRRAARRALDERLVGRRPRAILAGVADAVTAQDPDGRLVYVNDAAVRLLGFADRRGAAGGAAGRVWPRWRDARRGRRAVPARAPPGPPRARGRGARAGHSPLPRRGAGEPRWTRVKARPLRGADGRVPLAINVIEDITELKQAEETQRLPGRGQPRARRLARLRGHAAPRRRLAVPDSPTGARSTSPATAGSSASPSRTPTPPRSPLAARAGGALPGRPARRPRRRARAAHGRGGAVPRRSRDELLEQPRWTPSTSR